MQFDRMHSKYFSWIILLEQVREIYWHLFTFFPQTTKLKMSVLVAPNPYSFTALNIKCIAIVYFTNYTLTSSDGILEKEIKKTS